MVGVALGSGVAGAGVDVARGGMVGTEALVGSTTTGSASGGGGVINWPQPLNRNKMAKKMAARLSMAIHYTTASNKAKRFIL